MGAAGVAAAGNAAGAMAAKAIMGDQKIPSGGGMPGLTHSKGGGKEGNIGRVVQIDPEIAMTFYKWAPVEQENAYRTGLEYYKQSLVDASKIISKSFAEANATLRPLSESSNRALDEQMRMLGLDPVGRQIGMGDTLRALADEYKPYGNDYVNTLYKLAVKADEAENYEDPNQRLALKQEVNNIVNTFTQQLNTGFQGKIDALGARPKELSPQESMWLGGKSRVDGGPNPFFPGATIYEEDEPGWGTNYEIEKFLGTYGMLDGNPAIAGPIQDQINRLKDLRLREQNTWNGAGSKWDTSKASIQSQWDAAKSLLPQLQLWSDKFNLAYTEKKDKGYTGEQVFEKLKDTPGYQFTFNQGQKAVERGASARGLLNSGNTMLAVQDFGQQLATGTYQNYMMNLANITNQGSGATMQIADNQVSLGDYLSGLTQKGGMASNETERAIGDAKATAWYKQGDAWIDIAKFNASLQAAADPTLPANKSGFMQGASSMMNAGTNAGQLGLNRDKFNYDVLSSQNYGKGYQAATPAVSASPSWKNVEGKGAFYF